MENMRKRTVIRKGIFVLLMVVLTFALILPGCSDTQKTVPNSMGNVVSSASDTSLPEDLAISVIKPAGVGQPTELRLTASAIHNVGNVTARLEFKCKRYDADYLSYTKWETVDPKEMQIVAKSPTTGDLSYQHDVQFDYSVTFPYEGEWEILAYAESSENVKMGDAIYWSVQKDKAGGYGSDAYITDYAPPINTISGLPYELSFDMNKPPTLNEEAKITCEITAKEEIGNVEFWIEYWLMKPYTNSFTKFESESLEKSGVLACDGYLTKEKSIASSGMVAFPREGDWRILIWIKTPKNTTAPSEIYLHVDKDYSRWGWAESHK